MFISFSLGPPPRGTQSYASDLARRLRERDFTVFFSEDEAPPGEPLTGTLRSALYRSRVLVVVANRGTLMDPRWVRTEVEAFRERHPERPVIPISVGRALQDPALATHAQAWLSHQHRIWLDEDEQAVETGIASQALVDRLALAPSRLRANVGWRWIVRGVAAGLVMLTVTSIVAAIYAFWQRDEAVRQSEIAHAGRLAAQADLVRERGAAPDASVMLAAEGVRKLTSIGERSLEVDLSLRRALALQPQHIGEFDISDRGGQLSPTGEFVTFVAPGGEVKVHSVPDGKRRSCEHRDIVVGADMSKQARVRLVTGASANGDWCVVTEFDESSRQTLEVWTARPLKQLGRLVVESKAGHLTPAISDDGELIALTDRAQTGRVDESTLRLWQRNDGTELLRVDGEEFRGFSPDGRHFATTAGLWRLSDDSRNGPQRVLAWDRSPSSLAFSRDGRHVATRRVFRGPVVIWDVTKARALRETQPPEGLILAVRDDARYLVVTGNDGTRLWDTVQGRVRASLPLASVSAAFPSRNPTVLVEEVDRGSALRLRVLVMQLAGAALNGVDLDAGDRALWIGLRGDRLDLLLSSPAGIRLESWDFRNNERTTEASVSPALAWAVSADQSRFAVATTGRIVVGSIGAHAAPIEIEHAGGVDVVALSRDGGHLAIADVDAVHVRKLSTGEYWHSPALPGVPAAISVSSDGRTAYALVLSDELSRGGARHTLVRWHLADSGEDVHIDLGRYLRPLASLCFVSDDGRFVRAGGVRHPIDETTEALHIEPRDLTECEVGAPRSPRLVVQDAQVLATDMISRQTFARLDHGANVVLSTASTDGRYVATVDEFQGVQVFALDGEALVRQACARIPRMLSDADWDKFLGLSYTHDVCGRPRSRVR